jgi:hypothetical protein
MTRVITISAICLSASLQLGLCSAATFTWNGSVSADWFNADNWTPVGVPGSNDTVNFNSGSISLPAPITVGGEFNWSGGSLMGSPLTFASNSVLNIQGPVSLYGPLTNYGTVNWQAGTVQLNYAPYYGDYGVIWNEAGALWSIQCDQSMIGENGDEYFVNAGEALKTGGANTTSIAVSFLNSGEVMAQSGTIQLGGGSMLTNGTLGFGINSLTSFGQIVISGQATLGGALGVHFNNGYTPNPSNSFALVHYGSESGVFAPLNLPANIVWQTNYGAGEFALTVVGVEPDLLPSMVTNGAPNQPSEMRLQFSGSANNNYTILASTNLALPFSNWAILGNATLLSNTLYQFIDTQSTNFPARFYMLRSP